MNGANSPVSVYSELLKTTITLAGNYNITPFEVMAQDTDEVIMLINYLLELGQERESEPHKPQEKRQKDSFWDF